MTQEHPITPPPELIEDWIEIAKPEPWNRPPDPNVLCTLAAQWGADQELEACCALLELSDSNARDFLQSARRPKPPSLKEQALDELAWVDKHLNMPLHNHCTAIHTIRRALEQLDD
jgi:hypothetical protein